jgi:gamma-glutamylaminecyclotransferase
MPHRVFVYGTLKRGCPNNPMVEGCEFLGEGVTVLTYKAVIVPADKMVGTGFPVIMPDPSGKPVAGELYTN